MIIDHDTKIKMELQKSNPCGDFQVKTGIGDDDQICDFLSIDGSGFENGEQLSQMPLSFLALTNTSISSIRFIEQGVLQKTLTSLAIGNNPKLENFAALSVPPLTYLSLYNQRQFANAAIVPTTVVNLELVNSSLEELNFVDPGKIRYLTLMANPKLKKLCAISLLNKLERLKSDVELGDDLKGLSHLIYFELNMASTTDFPILPRHHFNTISIFACRNLKNSDTLKRMATDTFIWMSADDAQLASLIPTLLTMKIQVVNLSPFDEKNVIPQLEKLYMIEGLRQIIVNQKIVWER